MKEEIKQNCSNCKYGGTVCHNPSAYRFDHNIRQDFSCTDWKSKDDKTPPEPFYHREPLW